MGERDWLAHRCPRAARDARGVVAVARDAEPSDEDPEIFTLLAQMTATALAAVGLNRGVENYEARLRVLVETAPVGLVEVGPRAGAVVERGGQPRPGLARVPAGRRVARVPRRGARRARRALARGARDGAPAAGREIEEVPIGNRAGYWTVAAAPLPPTGSEPPACSP